MKVSGKAQKKMAIVLSLILLLTAMPASQANVEAAGEGTSTENAAGTEIDNTVSGGDGDKTVSGGDGTVSGGDSGNPPAIVYSITVKAGAGGTAEVTDNNENTQDDGQNIPADASRTICAKPEEGYEIANVAVVKGGAAWTPDGGDTEWWKAYADDGNFSFSIDKTDDNYEFDITFIKKKIEIIYNLSAKGKLTLNSEAVDESARIVLEAPSAENRGTETIDYTKEPYTIEAALTTDTYHLTCFTVDGIEQISDDEKGNDLNSKKYIFENGITQPHEIAVTAEIDRYAVSAQVHGEGIVVLSDGTDLTSGSVQADSGTDVIFVIKPKAGWQVGKLRVGGTDLTPRDCVVNAEGDYEYKVQGITADTKLEAEFSEILVERKSFADSGIVIENEKGKEQTPDSKSACYMEQAVIKGRTGKQLRTVKDAAYNDSVTIDSAYTLSVVYLRDTSSQKFGGETGILLTPPVRLVMDFEKPQMIMTEEEKNIFKDGNAQTVDLTGKVEDANPSRVVWSETVLDEQAILSETVNVTSKFSEPDKSFRLENIPLLAQTDISTFYLYAVDKAGHCSDACAVTVMRDSLPPEITKVELLPDTVNKCDFGNFFNEGITLQMTANDVDGPASGLESVRVYVGDVSDGGCYEKRIDGEVTGTEQKVIKISVPMSEKEFVPLSQVTMVAVDRMGNASGEYTLTTVLTPPAGVNSDNLMLEKHKPKIALKPGDAYIEHKTGKTLWWYKEIPKLEYSVTDKVQAADGGMRPGSGLAERKIFLAGKELSAYKKDDYIAGLTDYKEVLQKEDGSIAAGELSCMQPGENSLELWFKDLAGNAASLEQKVCLDRQKPEITGFTIERVSAMPDFLNNMLGFGNFTNTPVKITVTAEDAAIGGADVPSSGLNDITLYLDGAVYRTVKAENGKAEFILPAERILEKEERVYLNARITASASDNVRNVSDICDMTTGNSNLKSSHLMIETVKPRIQAVISKAGYVGPDGTVYNNSGTEFKVKVTDSDSGLRSVQISVNGMILEDEKTDKAASVKELAYTVNTGDAAVTAEGLYELTITAVDNAGNETVVIKRVYKDDTNPEILQYQMEAEGVQEADKTVLSYEETDYGYYFRQNTKVTVYATDGSRAGDCGVKEIRYYTAEASGRTSGINAMPVDGNGAISFTIPAGFKGQIYLCAYDFLGNSTEKYVTPDSLIIETPQQHEAEEHIFLEREDAPYIDNDGEALYADSVRITLRIADTFSGICKVEWGVDAPYDTGENRSGMIELDNEGEFTRDSSTEGWNRTKREKNLVTELEKVIEVTNNSNDIRVYAAMTDRAGNKSTQEITFSIDRTPPVIEISFDNMTPDTQYTELFMLDRIATITVSERNFSAGDFEVNITNTEGSIPGISEWSTAVNTENPDQTTSTATVTFSADGDYTFEVSGRDRASNAAETVKTDNFTIDKTQPVITVTYDNQNSLNGNYFAAQRTATIRVEEHNFSADRVTVNGSAADNGDAIAFPGIGAWSHSGDVHTASIVCAADGLYRFDVECRDAAGNEAEIFTGEEYYVDMTVPEIEITGVTDMSANNGDVIPQIVLSDTNYDVNGVNIELIGTNRGTVLPEGAYTSQGNGQIFTFANFPRDKAYDDIYTLHVSLTDMAGNESAQSVRFSVNRFGSVYIFDDALKEIEGTYIQDEIDVKLTEVNVDSLEHEKIRVVVNVNGTPRDLSENSDYTVVESGGNGNWYQYDYTLRKSLFEGDGRYIITLYSEDAAGNINENAEESKKAEISFGVDKTAPVVIPIDIESDAQYALDVKTATVAVNDNLVLEDVEVYIGREKCEYDTDGENYTFHIPSATTKQDVYVQAVDAAGNRVDYVISGVLVTTNAFIRWYNNKSLFAGTLAGIAAVMGGGVGLLSVLKGGHMKMKKKR